ncbi:hypothetical protein GCM10007385_18080 [Tateyamaria omphalii]|nr:hypothetical protein GCM10007385_18080 [Tateyamaria omphalii]
MPAADAVVVECAVIAAATAPTIATDFMVFDIFNVPFGYRLQYGREPYIGRPDGKLPPTSACVTEPLSVVRKRAEIHANFGPIVAN